MAENGKPSFIILILFFLLLLVACNNTETSRENQTTKKETQTPREISITAMDIAGNFSGQSSLKIDSSVTDSLFIRFPLLKASEKSLRNFYRTRNNSLAWHDSSGLIEQAGNLYNRMQNMEAEGLSSTIPYLQEIDSLIANENISDRKQASQTDLMLTAMYFYFADRVWGGLSEANTRKINWYIPRKKINYESFLDSLLTPGTAGKINEPVYRQYRLLKSELSKYRDLAAKNEWPIIVSYRKSYRQGDSSSVIEAIKKRLQLLGDLPPSPSVNNLFDVTLTQGVKKCQHRFGLSEDGIINASLLSELNISLQKRIEQIIINIERSRWVPDQFEGEYIGVNIPEFKLRAFDGDSVALTTNVVVGKAANKTVIFSGNLKYVVFSPYWNVPTSILKNEVLPGIRKNKNYLASHHMEWVGNSVRQKPGPWNSLGQVKFLFPNSHNIYFHDTPSKNLFKEDKRAFSHGCIRVENPKEFAEYLLRNDPYWTDKKIADAMNSGKEQYVTLKQPIPVFIGYLTAWVDRDNQLNFRHDVYGRDPRLAKMIQN